MEKVTTSQQSVERYEAIHEVFAALFRETKDIGKKKHEATLSEAKVRMINKVLEDIRLMAKDEPERKFLELLDDETLPQFGDAVLIMAQYEAVLKTFKERHYGFDERSREIRWHVE